MSTRQYVLGINAYDHDVSACLLRDGAIAFAVSKERLTRRKHDNGFFQEVVDYCLNAEGIRLDDVDLVVRNCYVLPVHDFETRLLSVGAPDVASDKERVQAASHPLYLAQSDRVVSISHHLAHAYSAFAVCPFEEGAIMVVDGVGNYCADVSENYPLAEVNPLARESESYYRFSGVKIETIKKIWLNPVRGFLSDDFFFMAGLGAVYSRVSSYIFSDWNKCGEVMGLAPYGRPNKLPQLIETKNGELTVPDWGRQFDKPWLIERERNWEASASLTHWQDLARQVQDDAETALLDRARWLRETTGAANLCMAGGVALNCVANGRIAREAGFDNVWIQPAAGDDGNAIGCAYYGHLAIRNNPRSFVMSNAYLGRAFTTAEVQAAAGRRRVRLQANTRESRDICRDTAGVLAAGHVVGWFQGRSEFGPRALGNRSILADPRHAEMKEVLNKRVKHRQSFRPFAPVVPAERAAEIFEIEGQSPFMLLAAPVRTQWRERIPAIVHVDGTARIQTVTREQNERLYRLLGEFEQLTGVPVLLNTSFNIKGEPIVETPQDAINCFLATGIDYLALDDLLLSKNMFHGVVAPVVATASEIAAIVKAALTADVGP